MTAKPSELPVEALRAARAERVQAMLERWAAEALSDEPDWDTGQIEGIDLSRPSESEEPRS